MASRIVRGLREVAYVLGDLWWSEVRRRFNKPTLVIEHCEDTFSPWIMLEYRHSSMIYGRDYLLFTNVPERYHKVLSKYGKVRRESIIEIVKSGEVKLEKTIVLDPKAPDPLTHRALVEAEYVVIGGILGDHPPRGRTWEYITSKMPRGVKAYNIGNGQYSIDGTAYYVNYMWEHRGLKGFKYVDGVRVETEHGEIYLPFRYPVVDGKPLLAEGLKHYLRYRNMPEEIWREITS